MSILHMSEIQKGYKQMTAIILEILLRPRCELSRAVQDATLWADLA